MYPGFMGMMAALLSSAAALSDISVVDHGDSLSSSSNSAVHTVTFNSQTATGPDVLACVSWHNATAADDEDVQREFPTALLSFTWNGVSGTILTQTDDDLEGCAIVYISGAQSGSLVFTFDAAPTLVKVTRLSLLNLVSATPVDTDTAISNVSNNIGLAALATPGVGGVRVVCYRSGGNASHTLTWVGVTLEDANFTSHGVAHHLGDHSSTISASISTATNAAICGVSLR